MNRQPKSIYIYFSDKNIVFLLHHKNDLDYQCKKVYIKIEYTILPYFGIHYVCKVLTKITHVHVDKSYTLKDW